MATAEQTKTEKYFRAAIFPHFCVLFSLFFTEFRFSSAIVVVIVFIVCLRIYLCVWNSTQSHTLAHSHTPHTPSQPYECANLYTRVLVFLTCMSRFVCLEFYYTEKKCFLLFHFGFCFVGRITKVKAPRLVI